VEITKLNSNQSPNFWVKIRQHKKLVFISSVLIIFIGYFIYLISGLPSLTKLENIDPALVTRVYSEDGEVIHELFKFNRVHVPIEKIPDHTITTLLSTEDRRFYQHWGIDIKRIPKVIAINLMSFRFRQGFSTITMQLARNLYFGFQKTLSRKFREIITAIQIERTYSKQEILEMYLNVAYFGLGVYGIQAAAKKYFDKDASDLTIEESATLIPILNLPAYYSPINHPDRSLARRNLVLRNMVVTKNLKQEEYDSLSNLPIVVKEFQPQGKIAPYFTEFIRQKLNVIGDSLGINVYEDGLNVYTTLNFQVQSAVDSAVFIHLPQLQERVSKKLAPLKEKMEIGDSLFAEKSKVQIAFVVLNHRNGHILAMTGGRDFSESKFNRAVQARRQPGSAFKPFLYTAAIDNGYTTMDKYLNQPVVVNNPDGTRWDPENYDKTFGGLTTLRDGLRLSLNLVAVRLILEIGPPAVVDYAHKMGLHTPLRPFPTLALGSSEAIPLELVSSYGVFANQGVRVDPVAITRIEDRFGNIIYQSRMKRSEILSKATAYIMTNLLESVVNGGTGGRLRWKFGFVKPAAGKTGTTNDFTDAWFVGFTPTLTAGVWVGLDDPKLSLGRGESGAIAALPIWAEFIKRVYENLNIPQQSFQQPADIIRLQVCQDSGNLATTYCPKVVEEVFNIKYHPTGICELHRGPSPNKKKKSILF
jgi:penicillin-binding protein 1A